MKEQKLTETEKGEEVMLPGFRFHPTDEELVGFYLKRKVQQKPLSVELIKQLDIYKFDPWELPRLATTGEKEWYFYCPRDRKYRNSARPNRVTGAGFWKATGTDRPIYSSEGSKCIGLKKSLVFYKGRAAKGIKTDWMMHEFRLPSLSDHSSLPKRPSLDRSLPPNDSWAICRIFKKSSSMAQRALSHSWVSPNMFETTVSGINSQTSQGAISEDCSGKNHFFCNADLQQSTIQNGFPQSDSSIFYKPTSDSVNAPKPSIYPILNSDYVFMFPSPLDMSVQPSKCSDQDVSSMLLNLPSSILGDDGKSPIIDFGSYHLTNSTDITVSLDIMNENMPSDLDHGTCLNKNADVSDVYSQWGEASANKTISFPFNLGANPTNTWRPSMPWDSPPGPSELSTSLFTTSATLDQHNII